MSDELKTVKLYNSLSRSVEVFAPVESDHVRAYCCGPTVYNYQHIGNLRTYIFEDVLMRTLRYAGYRVTHAMNITDVGHLVSDADEGEDKMAVASRREGKNSCEIAEFYTSIFFEHCSWLNINRPDIVCKATDHVSHMVNLIKRLYDKNFAYESGGNVYFDVSKLPNYGKLARLNLDNLQSGARIDVDDKKRNPYDFALWFTKSKFENQELQWDSPWGRGYPGWHIECSAMAIEHLGENIDIHCGGIDHIPVHHTNEIAQSEAATGKPFANYWLHGGFLVAGKDKMSKSKGEFLTLDVVKKRGFDPISYRLLCLGGTYRNELSWSFEALEAAQNSLTKIKNAITRLKPDYTASADNLEQYSQKASSYLKQFEDAVLTDLGMPRALSVLYAVIGDQDLPNKEKLGLLIKFDEIFGLGILQWLSKEQDTERLECAIPEEVLALAKRRELARAQKQWAEADALRDEIVSLGYSLEDSKDGSIVKKQ